MSVLAGYYQASTAEKQADVANIFTNIRSTNAQTDQIAPNAAAQRGALGAQANAANASAAHTQAQTAQVAPDAAAARGLQYAQTGLTGTQAGLLPATTASEIAQRSALTDATNVATEGARYQLPTFDQGYAKGGKVVTEKAAAKGKGGKPGPTDTVQAALTPGEVVMNKGAVEHYGSDVMAHMNRMGLMRMAAQSEVASQTGQPDPHAGLPGFGASHGAPPAPVGGLGMKPSSDAKAKPAKAKAA